MKNFRKVLAMILVVATLLSFATMASAAKKETLNLDYADQETITPAYEAAVDVLTSVGVLNGYESGEEFYFKPTAEIDRDEVAKMIAVLANAGDDVQEYYAEACTFADVKNTWAASYVAYCYHAGYVDGRNATTFDPDASITGIEVAKMLLCVAGFDADLQGYVGKDWKVNVLRDAKKVDLFAGMEDDFNPAANSSREEVAQMMFNLLHTDVIIGYVSDNVVKITNTIYLDDYDLEDGYTISLKDADSQFTFYGQAVAANGYTVGEVTFDFEHAVVVDCQGRPYNQWKYVTDTTQWAKVYAIPYTSRSTDGIDEVDTTYLYVDGKLMVATDAKYDGEFEDVKGLVVETYKFWNETVNKYETITVVLNTEVNFVEWVGRYQGAPYYKTYGSTEYVKNTEGFEEGDVVLVNYCNAHSKVHNKYLAPGATVAKTNYAKGEASAYLADVTVATVTDASYTNSRYDADWNRDNSYFKADGDKYEYHYNALGELVYENNDPTIVDTYMDSDDRNVEYALYTDEAGYVVLWSENLPEEPDYEYAYFVENSWTIELGDKVTPEWDEDGNYYVNKNNRYFNDIVDFTADVIEDVEIDAESMLLVKKAYGEDKVGLLAEYFVEEGVAYINRTAHMSHRNGVVVGVGDVDPETGVSATTNTEILVRTFNPGTNEYTYEAYQGYKELAKDYPGVIFGYGNEPAEIQYFVSETNPNKATHVFIDAAAATATDKFFLLGWEETRTSVQTGSMIEYFEVFSAVVDGELALVYIDTDMIEENEAPARIQPGLYDNEVMYLFEVDGQPVYRVAGMSLNIINADVAEWVEMDGDQLYYKKTDGTVENYPLADEFVMWVVNISYNEDEGAYTYVDIDSYTEDEDFNDEMVNNAGYFNPSVYVEYNEDGLVKEGYIVRYAEYTEEDDDPHDFFE